MEINWTTAAWIGAIVILYLFGYYEGRSVGYKRRKKEEAKEKETQPPPQPQTITETVTVTVDDPGLLRIKNEGGAFTLDLDGTRVNPLALSPGQRKRLIEMLNVIRPWLEGKPAPAPTPSVPASPAPSVLLDRVQSQTTTAALSEQTPPAPSPVQRAAPKPATIPKEDRPASPANSIVTQIDAILQARLEGTPLEERGVFLTESPSGGVMVYIGLTRYNGIDEVPDPEIKDAIRAAIKDWEIKYTPGL